MDFRASPRLRIAVLAGIALLAIGLGVVAYRLWSLRPGVSREAPNVILITIDTQRADRLSCYGYKKISTPGFDRLAREGVLFERAYCDVTWTTPSMSSVMTGSYATRHGLRSTYQQLAPENVTLAEVLRQHGYRTAAIVGSFPVAAVFGLDQGFESYDDHFSAPIVVGGDAPKGPVENKFSENVEEQKLFQYRKAQADAYRPDREVTDAALAWLRTHAGTGKFFLWLHYFGPHELQDLRLSWEDQVRQIVAQYDSQVQETDRQLGRLLAGLDELDLSERTLVILHADHGQSLFELLYVGHGKNLYDPTLRIPLLVRWPGVVPAGVRVKSLARNIDIYPTVLDLLGIRIGHTIDGESLRPLWSSVEGREGRVEREMYCETYLPATGMFADEVSDGKGGTMRLTFRRRGWRTPEWKLVLNEPWPTIDESNPPPIPPELVARFTTTELFHLPSNPFELQKGLVKDRPDIEGALRAKIEAVARATGHTSERRELDDAARERLRSLGYVE
jgi:arylsulfatase A-like enzyme